jgi:polar amino acid transport system substrate-binding protein
VLQGLRAEKAVFVEKPLAIDPSELDEIVELYNRACQDGNPPFIMVGYNRRFSPAMQAIKEFMSAAGEPLAITYRVNAGFLPATSWYQGSEQGGRVVGEVCHFVDTMQYLTGSTPVSVYAAAPANPTNRYQQENASVEVAFADGSVGHILYLANGAPAMPKEYMEAFGGGRCASMDSFKSVVLYDGRQAKKKSFTGDKGHAGEMKAVLDGIKAGKPPISFESLVKTSRATFAILDSLQNRAKVDIE